MCHCAAEAGCPAHQVSSSSSSKPEGIHRFSGQLDFLHPFSFTSSFILFYLFLMFVAFCFIGAGSAAGSGHNFRFIFTCIVQKNKKA